MPDVQRIREIMQDTLWSDERGDTGEILVAKGILHHYGFNLERLETHRDEVRKMLDELPREFQKTAAGGGGGWSFLNAAMDRDGHQWGEHRDIEMLFCLGSGLGMVICQLPREMWEILPGGMPYYEIDLDGVREA
jgi:hypothetical protein